LPNKKDELLKLVDEKCPSIIALTETVPKKRDEVSLPEYAIPGYDLFLNNNQRRGVAIYVKNHLNAQEYSKLTNHNFEESAWCTFQTKNGKKILFGCVYKSPNSPEDNKLALMDLLRSDCLVSFEHVCIVGDFNFPNIDWKGNWSGEQDNLFIECIRDSFLFQMVQKPTRYREGQTPHILDLVLVNDEQLISNIEHSCPIGKSDHEILLFTLYIDEQVKEAAGEVRYDVRRGHFDAMRKEFEKLDWTELGKMGTEESWQVIKTKILTSMEQNIPKKKITGKKKTKPLWMNNKTIRSIKKKHKAYKRYLNTKEGLDYTKYIAERNLCNKTIKKVKREYEKKIAKNCKTNAKGFWNYVKSKTKSSCGVSPLKTPSGDVTESDIDKANVLNDFFSSVFTKENCEDMPPDHEAERSEGITLNDIQVTPKAVADKLKNLNSNKAHGPDGIPSRVLKELYSELSVPLSILFNKSIHEGVVPQDWREATVTAIFKKGTRCDPGNYRPVSLTSIVCKTLESLIRDVLVSYMNENKLYTECQHGFRQHRSCITQLLEVMEELTTLIDNKNDIDIIYLDFSKAFDSVPHERLILKLKSYGITGFVLQWIESFLKDRVQRVRVGRDQSGSKDVISGIPQGSILGPILFTIFINDLPDVIQSYIKIFADDTKIFNSPQNSNIIQQDLNSLQQWSDTWQLKFNANKCKVLHIGKQNPCNSYYMQDNDSQSIINSCSSEKDLGVTFDSDFTFDVHINTAINKANKMLGVIRRVFSFIDKESFLNLYKSLVRPHLEYGNIIWYPFLKRQSAAIERVQRRSTKLIPELKHLSYTERLAALRLPSLKTRRIRGDLIQTFKIFRQIDDLDVNKFFTTNQCNITRNPLDKIFIQHCRTNLRKYSFTNRVAPLWNKLPDHVKLSPNLNTFKSLVDEQKFLKDILYDFDN